MSTVRDDQKFLESSTLYAFAGTALKVVSPLLTIVVARVFGKEAFGVYVSTQLWVLTMSRVAVLGLDRGLHWFIPRNKVEGRDPAFGLASAARRSFLLAALIAAVVVVGSSLGLQRLFSGLKDLSALEISLYVLALLPWVWLHLFAGASEGNRRPQYKIFVNEFAVYTAAPLISLVLHFCGVVPAVSLPVGLVAANLLGVAAYLPLIRRQFPNLSLRAREPLPKELLGYSLPLGVSEVVTSFLLRADLWMVLALLGPQYAGVYAVMVTISNGLRTIRQSYNPILLPVVAGMSDERLGSDLKPVYSYCVAMVTMIQLVIGFFIVLFPAETMMIAGKDFVVEPQVLGILLLGNLVNGMFGLSGSVINGLGKSRFMLMMNAVTLVFALACNRLLIPALGMAGAALSTMLYQTLQSVWTNVYLRRMGHWPYARSLWAQGAWGAAMLALYVALNNGFEPGMAAKIGLYAAALGGLVATFFAQGLRARPGKSA